MRTAEVTVATTLALRRPTMVAATVAATNVSPGKMLKIERSVAIHEAAHGSTAASPSPMNRSRVFGGRHSAPSQVAERSGDIRSILPPVARRVRGRFPYEEMARYAVP